MLIVLLLHILLAKRPPLGWNGWNRFGCEVNETLIMQTADNIILHGLHKLGYVYVNLDDCWQAPKRDPDTNRLVADPKRFPSGIRALADYMHNRGLKLGIYSDSGWWTCMRRPGSGGHEQLDADYLKYDNCFTNIFESAALRYDRMSRALRAVKRDIFFSICNWGQEEAWKWGGAIGDSWRISGDIGNLWQVRNFWDWIACPCSTLWCPKIVVSGGHDCSVINILDKVAEITDFTSIGGFNDADALEVGNNGMTFEEYKSHFSLWAALKSPLLLSTDMDAISPETMQIITNAKVIQVNQDPLGKSVKRTLVHDGFQVWAGPVSDALLVVVILNTDASERTMPLELSQFAGLDPTQRYVLEDLWRGALRLVGSHFSARIAGHGVYMFKARDYKSYQSLNLTITE